MTMALLDFFVKSTVLLALGAVVVLLMRRASAASRHAVWVGIFCAIALLPLASVTLPALRVPVLPPAATPKLSQFLAPAETDTSLSRHPASFSRAVSLGAEIQQHRQTRPVVPLLTTAWLAGVLVLLVRMASGAFNVRRLRCRARRVSAGSAIDHVDRARQLLGVRRSVEVLAIDEDVMPVTWGLWRPRILLPATADRTAHAGYLDAVILHEVAHIARLDVLSQLIAQLVTAALWCHPLVWMAQRAARLERERACDDVALRHGTRPADYAMELLMLVRSLRPLGTMVPGAAGAARRSQLDRRIRDILDRRVNRRGASVASLIAAVVLVGGSAPVAAVQLTARPSKARLPSSPIVASQVPTSSAPAASLSARPRLVVRAAPSLRLSPAPQTVVAQSTTQAEIPWHAERAEMYQQLVDITSRLIENCRAQVQIGTLAVIDERLPEATLEKLLLQAKQAVASQAPGPSVAERSDIRAAFADALRTLEIDKTKFSVGLLRLDRFDADILSAADVLDGKQSAEAVAQAAPLSQPNGVVRLVVTAGQSIRLALPFDIRRLTIGDPLLADVTGTARRELRIDGKTPGTVTLIVWGDESRVQYEIDVKPRT